MHTPDDDNIIFNTAADFINNSNHPVFLTGKAGTGKTTFLKYIKENTLKNTAVVAPTGVAAINAGGTTIHSFFQLPFGPYIPVSKTQWGNSEVSDKQNLISKLRLTRNQIDASIHLHLYRKSIRRSWAGPVALQSIACAGRCAHSLSRPDRTTLVFE